MNEEQAYSVVRLSAHEFDRWLISGVCRLTITHQWPNEESFAQTKPEDYDSWVFVALPSKYSTRLNTEHGINALIDDALQISCVGNEQTDELRARLHTLGETWLPIEFLPDVVTPRPQRLMGTGLPEVASAPMPEQHLPTKQLAGQIVQSELELPVTESAVRPARKRRSRAIAVKTEVQIDVEKVAQLQNASSKQCDVEPATTTPKKTRTRSKKQQD